MTNLKFGDSLESPYLFHFSVACTKCRERRDNAINFNAYEVVDLAGSRGEANFAMKCKFCANEGNVNVATDLKKVYYAEEESGGLKQLVKFDCRGLDLVEFLPLGAFTAESLANGSILDVEFEDGEWFDYDEAAGSEVSIVNTQWTIQKSK